MALKSGISGISRRPATEPDEAGSTEITPRDRLMRRAGMTTTEAAADPRVEPTPDTLDEQDEIEAEEEAEQGEQLVMLNEDFVPEDSTDADSEGNVGDLQGGTYAPQEKNVEEPEFKPGPVGRPRGRPKAGKTDPGTEPKSAAMSIVELRAEIKGVEGEMKDVASARAELNAKAQELLDEHSRLTVSLAVTMLGG